MKIRIIVLLAAVVAIGIIPLTARLFQLQIVEYEKYQQKAVDQQTRDTIISPKRGNIYDRNLKALAESASVETVYISPLEITRNDEDPELIARKLSELLDVDYDSVLEKCGKTKTQYQIIKRGVERDAADLVREFKKDNNLRSVQLAEDTKRYYPYGNFASHILGFVGTENHGLAGIEALYDEELQGVAGRIVSAKDAQNSDMPFKYDKYVDAQNGLNVVLTIDEVIQHFLEKHLETALIENELGKKAMGIVMNVNTGEILAMAVKQDYDPNEPFNITDESILEGLSALEGQEYSDYRKSYLESVLWRNELISDTYEPGSVFKSFTAAMALEEGLTGLDTAGYYCGGAMNVGPWRIACWKKGGHGQQSFIQGLQNSCNCVFMTIAPKIGREKFYKYQRAFGFGEKTGIDLIGETSGAGLLHSVENLNEAEIATSSFGQTFKVTPIQMICGLSAIANGGTLYKPYVVKELINDDGVVVSSTSPTPKRQVISKQTSDLMRIALESVVSQGTGKNAYVRGYHVAGKTGTSEKRDVFDQYGNIDQTKRIASFGSFAPANDPQVAVLVILDEPKDYVYGGGGAIAAPVAGAIMEDVLKYLNIEPQYTDEELREVDVSVPEVVARSVADAEKIIKNAGLNVKIEGGGDTVIAQIPRSGNTTPSNSTIFIYTGDAQPVTSTVVPNVVGMTPSEANKAIVNAYLNVKLTGAKTEGDVIVSRQTPYAGEETTPGSIVTIELRGISNTGE